MVREKLKGFSKDALIYGLGDGIGRLTQLILLPILSRIFGPADYGAIDLLAVSYFFLHTLMKLGVPTGVQRYYYRVEGAARKDMVSSCGMYLLLLNVALGAILHVSSSQLAGLLDGPREQLESSIRILAWAMPVEQLWSFLLLLLRLNRRSIAFSVLQIVLVVVQPVLVFVFVVSLDMQLPGIFLAKLVSLALITLALVFLNRREFTPNASVSHFLRVTRFAIPGHPALLINTFLVVAPRYLLALFAPLSAVGLFGIALRVSSVMKVVMEAFNRAWNPFAYANEGSSEERRLYELVFKTLVGGLVILCASVSLFAREILTLLTPPEYREAWHLIPGILVAFALDGLVRVFSTILYTRDLVRWGSYLGLLRLAVFASAGLFLAPRYDAAGVVLALVISSLVHTVVYAGVALQAFPFRIDGTRLVALVAVALLLVVLMLRLELPLPFRVATKLAAGCAIAVLALRLLLNDRERVQIRALLPDRSSH